MADQRHGVQRVHRLAGRGRVAQQQALQRHGLGRQDRQQPQESGRGRAALGQPGQRQVDAFGHIGRVVPGGCAALQGRHGHRAGPDRERDRAVVLRLMPGVPVQVYGAYPLPILLRREQDPADALMRRCVPFPVDRLARADYPPLPDAGAAEAHALVVAELVRPDETQGADFQGLFDHRGEHVDVADGHAFGKAAVDEQRPGQAPPAQVIEGHGDGWPSVPHGVLGTELDVVPGWARANRESRQDRADYLMAVFEGPRLDGDLPPPLKFRCQRHPPARSPSGGDDRPFPDPVVADAPAQLAAVFVGRVHEQGPGRVVGLFDHRREHVDVADGNPFGEEGEPPRVSWRQ